MGLKYWILQISILLVISAIFFSVVLYGDYRNHELHPNKEIVEAQLDTINPFITRCYDSGSNTWDWKIEYLQDDGRFRLLISGYCHQIDSKEEEPKEEEDKGESL